MTYADFISRFEKLTPTKDGVMVRCPAHPDGTASLAVGEAKDGGVILHCHANCRTESVVAALGLEMKDLFAKELPRQFTPPPAVRKINGDHKPKPEIEKTYSYTDEMGRELYQAVRMKPKDFRQRHSVDGKWVWSMAGVELVLYGLAGVLAATQVWIVEGEKDADNLTRLGFCATTNVGGAGKWLDGYTASIKGKHVVLCGDNDDAGRKHVEKVFESIASKAASVKIVKLPAIYKDVSDLIEERKDKAREMLIELEALAVPHIGGLRMPVYSMANIEPKYISSATKSDAVSFDLSKWLPSLRYRVRPLLPGSLVLIVGGTGSGKTMLLQNIAMAALNLKTLFFELELSEEELFERFMAIKNKCECADVETEYRNNPPIGHDGMMRGFPNLFICPEPRLTIDQMEAIILRAELKMGGKPLLVLLDYVQLVQGEGKSRYEKVSNIAEALKSMAKATKTIVIVASQIDRASGKEGEIGLHSAKDSGSLENSAGLVLSAVRDEEDSTLMRLRILKSTKGHAGYEVLCNIDGAKATITERAGRVML